MDIGRQVRRLRLEQDLDIAALARRTGLSRPFLSQVEAGTADPSMKSLRRLAEALGVPPMRLLDDGSTSGGSPDSSDQAPAAELPISMQVTSPLSELAEDLTHRMKQVRGVQVVRSEKRKSLVWPDGIDRQLLTPDLRRLIQVILTDLEPGDSSGEPHTHAGETFQWVLEGRQEILVDGESYILEQGDSISYPSHLPHCDGTIGEGRARVLTVNVPPDF